MRIHAPDIPDSLPTPLVREEMRLAMDANDRYILKNEEIILSNQQSGKPNIRIVGLGRQRLIVRSSLDPFLEAKESRVRRYSPDPDGSGEEVRVNGRVDMTHRRLARMCGVADMYPFTPKQIAEMARYAIGELARTGKSADVFLMNSLQAIQAIEGDLHAPKGHAGFGTSSGFCRVRGPCD